MNYAIKQYLNDTEGRPDGWPREVRQLADGDITLRAGEILVTIDEYNALIAQLKPVMDARQAAAEEHQQIENETYLIPKEEFFARLTLPQWGTINALRETDQNVAYFWDLYNSLRLGIYGPPDGKTPERVKSQQAAALLTAIFGEQETARLLAKSTN